MLLLLLKYLVPLKDQPTLNPSDWLAMPSTIASILPGIKVDLPRASEFAIWMACNAIWIDGSTAGFAKSKAMRCSYSVNRRCLPAGANALVL